MTHPGLPTGAAGMPLSGVASQPSGGAIRFTTPATPTELPATGAIKAKGKTAQLGTARDYLCDTTNRLTATNRKARLTAVSFKGTLSGNGVMGVHVFKNGQLLDGASAVVKDTSGKPVAVDIQILTDLVVGDYLEVWLSGDGPEITVMGSLQAIG